MSTSAGAALTYDPLGRLWQISHPDPQFGTRQFLYDGDALLEQALQQHGFTEHLREF